MYQAKECFGMSHGQMCPYHTPLLPSPILQIKYLHKSQSSDSNSYKLYLKPFDFGSYDTNLYDTLFALSHCAGHRDNPVSVASRTRPIHIENGSMSRDICRFVGNNRRRIRKGYCNSHGKCSTLPRWRKGLLRRC